MPVSPKAKTGGYLIGVFFCYQELFDSILHGGEAKTT